ncbi:short-chain dehydrogenase/reductase family 9C member 7-like [Oculina patagonica]
MFAFSDFLSFLFSFRGVLLLIVLVLTLYITCNFLCDVRVSDLEKKAVLITGCDSGFGYELAKKLDAQGLRVFAACLTSEGEAKLKNECSQELRTLKMDVTESSDVQKALELVKSNLPSQGLWALVNNAGVGFPGLIEWETVEGMKRTVDINLWGMVSVTKAFLPLLKRPKGRVVNVASSWGRVAVPGASAYSIAKFGVQAFSDCLRNEMRHFGVTVHIIEPGMFKTKILDPGKNIRYLEALWENLDADTKECYGKEFYEKAKESTATEFQLLKSPHIYKVVDAMVHAVTSTRPKLRYGVGRDHIIWRILSFLPSEIQDLMFFSFPKPKGISDR